VQSFVPVLSLKSMPIVMIGKSLLVRGRLPGPPPRAGNKKAGSP
jgi:hypothetical protein